MQKIDFSKDGHPKNTLAIWRRKRVKFCHWMEVKTAKLRLERHGSDFHGYEVILSMLEKNTF